MDQDDLPQQRGDPVAALRGQDLDPLSVAELAARIAALKEEIARTQAKIEAASSHRASAEALFR